MIWLFKDRHISCYSTTLFLTVSPVSVISVVTLSKYCCYVPPSLPLCGCSAAIPCGPSAEEPKTEAVAASVSLHHPPWAGCFSVAGVCGVGEAPTRLSTSALRFWSQMWLTGCASMKFVGNVWLWSFLFPPVDGATYRTVPDFYTWEFCRFIQTYFSHPNTQVSNI